MDQLVFNYIAPTDLPILLCLHRQPPSEEEEMLKQALLGADIEAPAAKKKRAWCVLLAAMTSHACTPLTPSQ